MSVVFRTLFFIIFIHGFFLIVIPWILIFLKVLSFFQVLTTARWLALLPLVMGLSFYISCVRDFIFLGKGTPAAWDSPVEFVLKGWYRRVRNPMYIGMFLILASEAIFFESAGIFLYAIALWFSFHLFVVYQEEPALKRKFGCVYRNYLKSVPRWIPLLRRPRGQS